MQLCKSNALILLIAYGSLIAPLNAQPRPEPGSATVPSQSEPPTPGETESEGAPPDTTKKWAYLRVWNFAGRSSKETLGIFAKPEKPISDLDVHWIARGVGYGSVGRYVEVPAGNHVILILSDPVNVIDPEKPANIKQPAKSGSENLSIKMSENDYYTLIIEEENGQIKSSFLKDSDLPVEGFSFRAINMTRLTGASIVEVKGGQASPFFDELSPAQWVTKTFDQLKRTSLELRYKDENGFPMKQYIEIEPVKTRSVSMVLFYDRYDRPTFQSFADAPKVIPSSTP
jgi:hypothetical protein